ncbi:MAG: polysaccharide pyruvyl transferase family protein [Mobilitalea sp.]
MKIGVLTFHYAINYGAVLQAFATQTWLNKQDVDSDIINYIPYKEEAKYDPKMIEKNCFIDLNAKPLRSVLRWIRYKLLIEKDYVEKTKKFKNFLEKSLKMTPIIRNNDELNNLNNAGYDAYICGSDQIWNPEITTGFDRTYFCGFSNNHIKKIAYAASAGDIEILNRVEIKELFFDLLRNFNNISVREQSLADFITTESTFKAVTTLDSTLLLERDDYDRITVSQNITKKEYLLIYQLSRNTRTKEIAIMIAKERNLEIIEVCGTFYNKLHSKNILCNIGPSELLGLIRDASYVVTNSFHGTTLSIIYKKDFNTVLSKKRNSRIIDLLGSIKLDNRIVMEDNTNIQTNIIDYSNPLEILENLKIQSNVFLKKSLGLSYE